MNHIVERSRQDQSITKNTKKTDNSQAFYPAIYLISCEPKKGSVGMPPDMARPAGRWRWKRIETGIIFPCQLGGGTNRRAAKSLQNTRNNYVDLFFGCFLNCGDLYGISLVSSMVFFVFFFGLPRSHKFNIVGPKNTRTWMVKNKNAPSPLPLWGPFVTFQWSTCCSDFWSKLEILFIYLGCSSCLRE